MAASSQTQEQLSKFMEDLPPLPQDADIHVLLYAPEDTKIKEWTIRHIGPLQLDRTVQSLDFVSEVLDSGVAFTMIESTGPEGELEVIGEAMRQKVNEKEKDTKSGRTTPDSGPTFTAEEKQKLLQGSILEGIDDAEVLRARGGYIGFVVHGRDKAHEEGKSEEEEEHIGDIEDKHIHDKKDKAKESKHEGVKVAQHEQEVKKHDKNKLGLSLQTAELLLHRLKLDFNDLLRGNVLALALLCGMMFALGLAAGR